MNQINTTAIVLSRTDYGEADRILTMLSPDHGKLRLMAKGVRRIKSKLAGGIELFSVSEVAYIKGRGEIGTLVSSRLLRYYELIVKDVNRTMLGYELIKLLHRITEDETEAEYYTLLEDAFNALNDVTIDAQVIRAWFLMQLLRLGGHSPNLHTDVSGTKLEVTSRYDFNFDDMAFAVREEGHFTANHIKLLRVGFSGSQPRIIQKITSVQSLITDVLPLIQTMAQTYIRL